MPTSHSFRNLTRKSLPMPVLFLIWMLIAQSATAAQELKNNQEPAKSQAQAESDLLLSSLKKELTRSRDKLSPFGQAPLYFISYAVYDVSDILLSASYGALDRDNSGRRRSLAVELRVGNKTLDNTHKLRASVPGSPLAFGRGYDTSGGFPLEDDQGAVRTSLWQSTDAAFKRAQQDYCEVKTNRDIRVAEEDASPDFSDAPPVMQYEPVENLAVDSAAWRKRLREASALFKQYPDISEASVTFSFESVRRYLVNSEGTSIVDNAHSLRVTAEACAIARDGMVVRLYDGVECPKVEDLPSQEALKEMVNKLAKSVVALKNAPRAEPYVGPAVLNSKAAGVFFHEVLGHRVEGHRQKDETEGRTFAQKVGEQIMPTFMSVSDDPTRTTFGAKPLVGYYRFDNEGVAAQKVNLVDKGILRSFLMGRSPIHNMVASNGHGRCAPGLDPVARQGNLIIDSSKRVPYAKLRAMLIQEAKAQHKPYGVIIDEIAGGFTITQTFMPQSYVLLPLRVTRVYGDGRADELTRGVNIVGTPLSSLEKIVCAARDDDTFNGRCGAESGWVPVSATSPSLLVKTIELEKEYKQQDQPPILPPPALKHD